MGDSYNITVDKINKDPLFKYYSVTKSKNRILVSIMSGSGLGENSANTYDFEKKHFEPHVSYPKH